MKQNLTALNPEQANGKEKELFELIKSNMWVVPNILKTMANAPHVVEAYLGFSQQLKKSSLDPKLVELIALYVATLNQCDYCVSAHSYVAQIMEISTETTVNTRLGKASDPKIQALLSFVKAVVTKRGRVEADEVAALQDTGYAQAEIVEVAAVIGINLFTNYFSFIANLENDFPPVEKIEETLNSSI